MVQAFVKANILLSKIYKHDFKTFLQKTPEKKLPVNPPSENTTSKVSSLKRSAKIKKAYNVKMFLAVDESQNVQGRSLAALFTGVLDGAGYEKP